MKLNWLALVASFSVIGAFTAKAQQVAVAADARASVEAEITLGKPELELPVPQDRPEPPERPERPDLSEEIKELATEFRAKVGEVQAARRELVAGLKSATAEGRAEIREQLKANREELKQLKEEFQNELKELTEALKDQNARIGAEVAAAAKAEANGRKARD